MRSELTDAGTLARISVAPSRSTTLVAVIDPGRGPVFRAVHPGTLSARLEDGAGDPALTQLIRRTPPPAHGAAQGGGIGLGLRALGPRPRRDAPHHRRVAPLA